MSKFTEAISALQNKLPKEEFEKVADEIITLKSEHEELEKKEYGNYKDSMNRKEKVEKLEEQLSTVTQEKENLEKKLGEIDLTKIEQERDDALSKLADFEKTQNADRRKKFLDKYELYKDHANFEKIKGKIKIAELKDNEVNWDSLSSEEINVNLEKITDYEDAGVFGDVGQQVPPAPQGHHKPVKGEWEDYPE